MHLLNIYWGSFQIECLRNNAADLPFVISDLLYRSMAELQTKELNEAIHMHRDRKITIQTNENADDY